MITLVSGLLGGGKSLFAVEKMGAALLHGKHVYTNHPLLPGFESILACTGGRHLFWDFESRQKLAEKVKSHFHFVKNFDEIPKNRVGRKEEHSRLLVLDEVGRFLNARDWKTIPKTYFAFFSLSRRLGYEILLLTQDLSLIDKQIRDLCQWEVRISNLKYFRIPIFLFSFPFPLKGFIRTTKMANTRLLIGRSIDQMDPVFARCYDSHQTFDEFFCAQEAEEEDITWENNFIHPAYCRYQEERIPQTINREEVEKALGRPKGSVRSRIARAMKEPCTNYKIQKVCPGEFMRVAGQLRDVEFSESERVTAYA